MSGLAWARRRLRAIDLERLLRAAAALTLVALGLMVWSMIRPTPLPVMLAMTVGQAIGTLAFALYGYVVLADLRRSRRARREGEAKAMEADAATAAKAQAEQASEAAEQAPEAQAEQAPEAAKPAEEQP